MRNLLFFILAMFAIMQSCQKSNDFESELLESSQVSRTYKGTVPTGWEQQNQIIVIEGQMYDVVVAGNPKTDEMMFMDVPKEVELFFLKYEETLLPHVIISDTYTVVYYYKDEDEFNRLVSFAKPKSKFEKSYQGGFSKSFQHSSTGYHGGWGNHLRQDLINYSNYFNTVTEGWGESASYVGGTMNDEISSVQIWQLDYSDPINYFATQHSQFGGKKLLLSKTSSVSENTAYMWAISFGWFKSWNDKISSCETWQSNFSHPDALEM